MNIRIFLCLPFAIFLCSLFLFEFSISLIMTFISVLLPLIIYLLLSYKSLDTLERSPTKGTKLVEAELRSLNKMTVRKLSWVGCEDKGMSCL